ncbi:MAG: FAD/NAD(P)-binding protein [Actinophytocola sp.]|uniref:FAD/NAD(P)-binding protein n=1 Tax=Actinophytocola sp. TaxID=1872138 RepID=UPI003D6C3B83
MRSAGSSVAVVGAGASGVVTALRLLELAGDRELEVLLVDPTAEPGRGIAYSTRESTHLLNVPAGRLSADAADPDHFARWAARRLDRPVGLDEFLPRHLLGSYLGDLLDAAIERRRGARLRLVRERVTGVRNAATGVTLRLASGDTLSASAAVLAIGLSAPASGWAPAALRESPAFVADPWAPEVAHAEDGDILFVGSGLTMVDLAIQLDRPHRTMHVVSRTGLLPRRHLSGRTAPRLDVDELTGAAGVDAVWRAVSTGRGWRAAVDGLRRATSRIWGELGEDEQARFLAEKSRFWNCIRHRMAPAAADRLREIRRSGRLRLHTGEVTAVEPDGDLLCVTLTGGEVLRVRSVVNCTGPSLDLRGAGDPLVAALLADGLAVPGPHGLGLDTDKAGRLRAGGRPTGPLWTIGATRVGTLWESTAFPEIRDQAAAVAESVLSDVDENLATVRRRPRDRYGMPLSTIPEAAEAFTLGVDQVLSGQQDALEYLTAATEADPGFALGHAVIGLLGLEIGAPVDVAARVRDAQAFAVGGDDRERSFVAAVVARAADLDAGGRALLRHIKAYPRDALAVNVAVPTIAFGGITSDRETWSLVESLQRDYGDDWWYLSQLAFVRQDQGRWEEAEALSSRALAAEPRSGHAVHARTHVFYETGEHKDGLSWLNGWINRWGPASDGRVHFTWHAALHELMLGDDAAVRRRYDNDLAPPAVAGPRALVDSASLLWRCEMTRDWDGRVGANAVLDVSPDDWLARPATAFAAMHAAIAMAAARDEDRLRALRTYAAGHDSAVYRQVVAPLCAGLADVVAGRWNAAVAQLDAIRPHVERLGGSAAQREVIEDTYVHALASAGRHEEAAAVLSARLDRRPPSPLEQGRLAVLRKPTAT